MRIEYIIELKNKLFGEYEVAQLFRKTWTNFDFLIKNKATLKVHYIFLPMNAILRIGQAATLLQVSTKSIRRWDKAGKICCFRTPGGHRRITLIEIERIKSGQDMPKISLQPAIYARVSSHEQKRKGDLQRQIETSQQYCESQGFKTPQVFQDTGSGLNTKRRGFSKLCQAIEQGKVNHVVLTYPDRLTRFGFLYLE